MREIVKRARKKNLPQNLASTLSPIDARYTLTSSGEPWLQRDLTNNGKRLLVFASPGNINLLGQSEIM